uniref:Uncharacterized protein MANES_05G101200 n=1 Tax=Rhizophora mucronata TaxID=61149 RepID=A0A2P2QNK2_RHIMU
MRKRPRRLIQVMGTGNFFATNTHFDVLANKDAVSEFVYANMYRVVASFWVLFCGCMCCVFGSIFRFIFRVRECKSPGENKSNFSVVYHQREDEQIGFSSCSQNPEMEKSNRERENSFGMDTTLSVSTNNNKYEFLSRKAFSGFVEEPRTFSFTIHEFFSGATDDTIMNTPVLGGSSDDDFRQVELDLECFSEEKSEKTADFSKSSVIDKVSEAEEEMPISEEKSSDEKQIVPGDKISTDNDTAKSGLDAEDVLVTEETEQNVRGLVTHEVLSNGSTIDQRFTLEIPILIEEENAGYNEEPDTFLLEANSADSDEEFIELKFQNLADIREKNGRQDSSQEEGEQETHSSIEAEEPSLEKNEGNSDFDVQDDPYEFELEDIVQQLKMELKNARTGGLPPILEEESESEELETPKIVQELKPITIEEKIERKDVLAEIQKVYKRYSEKMKKLDILNFQTWHALD